MPIKDMIFRTGKDMNKSRNDIKIENTYQFCSEYCILDYYTSIQLKREIKQNT